MIFTIGHSTRPIAEFLSLLSAHQITHLADVRTVPRSRRHPHFEQGALSASLGQAGMAYRHFPVLGGLRKPKPDSSNSGWKNASFRGYADHMQTPAFDRAVEELLAWPGDEPDARVVIMCAEAVWWQCHRQLIADALVARGIDVAHIMSAAVATPHTLTSFARVESRKVLYPGLL